MIETIKMSKMKKILYILTLVGICSFSSCSDALDTNPTDKVSGSLIFGNADAAQVAMNGVYRSLFITGWSDNWAHENPGLMAVSYTHLDGYKRQEGNGISSDRSLSE